MKVCIGCHQVLDLAMFVAIKGKPGQHYSRCKLCRAAKARARYHASPEVREAEIARALRNQRKRRGPQAT